MGLTELTMVIGSALLHAIWSAVIKRSRDPLAFNVLQEGMVATVAVVALPLLIRFDEVPPGVWWLIVGTGVAHGLYMYFMARAYERADLTLVYPIIRSTPAFLPLLAWLWGERLSGGGIAGIVVVVAGIWLVHVGRRLRLRELFSSGMGFAYLTLCATLAYSLIDWRAMVQLSDGPWTGAVPRSVAYFLLLSAAHILVLIPLAWPWLRGGQLARVARTEWRVAGVAVLISLGSYGLVLEAYRTTPPSYVVAVRQTSVLFAVLIGTVWLAERPGWIRVAGATATVAGVAIIYALA